MASKALMGAKIRRLRRASGLTQARMAERLNISPSYLNLIENNQRAITVDLLLRIGQAFEVDLQSFAEDDTTRMIGALCDAFADPTLTDHAVERQDLIDLVEASPAAGQAVLALYNSYKALRNENRVLSDQRVSDASDGVATPAVDQVRDYLQAAGNYVPELEAAAEADWSAGELDQSDLYNGLVAFLDREQGLRVRIVPVDVMGDFRRRYDRHGRRILLSEMLDGSSRCFHLAVQTALIRHRGLLDELVARAALDGDQARALLRLAFANYYGGAVLMPYDRLYRAAEAVRYDLEILRRRFRVGLEALGHRLTTLQRPGASGIPFFLLRLDQAGNISKRFSAGADHFPRLGGSCPRWIAHEALWQPGRILTQVVELPDGQRYFTLATAIGRPGAGFRRSGPRQILALGCDIAHAAQLVYADGIAVHADEVAEPIGPTCRLCERSDCVMRAYAPSGVDLDINESLRPGVPYALATS
ncbi:MAG: DUF2083 domain-containing protein [Rhodospirillaceae bacterium]|nr:DUF2083 domain-containing protein [Rhodospirillaceae bacterium]